MIRSDRFTRQEAASLALGVVLLASSSVLAQPVPNPYDEPIPGDQAPPAARPAAPPRPPPARARVTPPQPNWHVLKGAWVAVLRRDGTWIQGRLWPLSGELMVITLGKRSTVIPAVDAVRIQRLARRPAPEPRVDRTPRPASTASGRRTPKAKPFLIEWVSLRGFFGGGTFWEDEGWITGGAEIGFFGFVWRHAYFEVLRFSGGYPYMFYFGTAFGIRGVLDAAGLADLRFGLHLSMPYFMMFMPTMSGLDLMFTYRPGSQARVQFGVKVFAFPPAGVVMIGFSI